MLHPNSMAPPRARSFVLDQLAAFDDEALRTFLAPGDVGVDAARLGTALQGREHDDLAARVEQALGDRAAEFDAARSDKAPQENVERARRQVVRTLFWPLLYWHDPDGYEELVAGEQIHPGLLDALDIDGKVVADIGAGAGRFTVQAARRARKVIAVDAVPPLLQRLERKVRDQELDNVEIRRGSFLHIPIPDAYVDVAVACSSLTSQAPWGGDGALRETQRIVKARGEMVVIWPDDPSWFCARGFTYVALPGATEMHFRDWQSAERLCRDYYSEDAARWVRERRATVVPFHVLGVKPPSDACIKRIAEPDTTTRPYGDDHPRPGVDVTPSR